MDEMITDKPETECFVKAQALGEPTFTLRAQDVTAALFVQGWAYAQLFLQQRVKAGLSISDAVAILGDRMHLILNSEFISADVIANHQKAAEALKQADRMREWPVKKVAD